MIRKPTVLSQVKLYSGLEGAFVKGVEIMDGSICESLEFYFLLQAIPIK